MNCVEMNCKHCKCRELYLHMHSSIFPDSILDIYCEKGRPVRIPFLDNGAPMNCEFYEKLAQKTT